MASNRKGWPKIRIELDSGEAEAIAPSVLSISRASDIPAFHMEWLMKAWDKGYCQWTNPFNGARKYVSFKNVRAMVFWSKNPSESFFRFLEKLSEEGVKWYFHFTFNDYQSENLEPGVPALEERSRAFLRLAKLAPVIWRYDPVILSSSLTIEKHLLKIENLMRLLAPHAEALVFSFADLSYRGVKNNLNGTGSKPRSPSGLEKLCFAEGLSRLRDKSAPGLRLAACAAQIDLSKYGIERARCVDPDLLERICREGKDGLNDPEPMARGAREAPAQAGLFDKMDIIYDKKIRGLKTPAAERVFDHAKDPGQRKECGCAKSKDIGSYRMPCRHGCRYCYAGHGFKS